MAKRLVCTTDGCGLVLPIGAPQYTSRVCPRCGQQSLIVNHQADVHAQLTFSGSLLSAHEGYRGLPAWLRGPMEWHERHPGFSGPGWLLALLILPVVSAVVGAMIGQVVPGVGGVLVGAALGVGFAVVSLFCVPPALKFRDAQRQ